MLSFNLFEALHVLKYTGFDDLGNLFIIFQIAVGLLTALL